MKTSLAIIFILPFFIFSQEKANSSEKKTNNIPEINAMFPGGNDEMRKFTKENLIYPELAELHGNQGRVYVDFIVTKEGEIKDVEVVRGVSAELDEEAVRFVKSMPNWTPAVLNGEKIDVKCRIPVVFEFSKEK